MLYEFLSVDEAAFIMRCHPRTVRNLLKHGCLSGPACRPGSGITQVTTKSLFQYLIVKHASRLRGSTFKQWKAAEGISQKSLEKLQNPVVSLRVRERATRLRPRLIHFRKKTANHKRRAMREGRPRSGNCTTISRRNTSSVSTGPRGA